MMMREYGVNSDGGQEVRMESRSTEETVQESQHCTDLEAVFRFRVS